MLQNCLELIWNGVPCSVQQAYEILIDDSVCTLEEYRVYSQLTRYGYHIQRYFSEEPKCNRSDEGTATKRKIIVDPNNGLRMCDSQLQSQDTEKLEETVSKDKSQISNRSFDHFKTKNDKTIGESIEQVVHNVLDKLLCIIEDDVDLNNPIASVVMQNNAMQSNMSSEEKNRNSKPEIISDETLLDNIKIFKGTCNSNKKPCKVSKWSGARIQRNVKQLPKRTDKISTEISIIDSDVANESSRSPDKRNQVGELSSMKKHEVRFSNICYVFCYVICKIFFFFNQVIELSDDEIQELPHSMTRKEILNMLPNIAFQNCIVEKISRRYIPHTIRPQKSAYFYNRMQISRIQEDDKRARQNCKNIRTDTRQNSSQFENSADVHDRSIAFQNQQSRSLLGSPSRLFYPGQDQMHNMNIGLPYTYRFPFNYNQNIYMQNRIMQNTFHNLSIFLGNLRNAFQQSRNFTIMMNNFTMPVMEGYRMRHFSVDNQFRHSFQQNILWQHRFFETRSTIQNTSIQSSAHLNYPRQRQDYANSKDRVSHETVNRCSFTTYPGANSWTELKRRWSEEKTIIIDDEDNKNKNESEEECNEVQVVKLINPLIGPRNASSLMESFNKLAIIKSAPERTVRRKKSRYKISYNVYSCTHHYRKANPGQPLYSLVVIRYLPLIRRKIYT